ncbi:hypothetical protein N8I77_009593 [Diaporthe amygdali]|uniref:Clr5 domain-containing protein n=1 Tax=Phomopsis amygdali TaxID=1214568 RepID=A0AAD9SCZ0_PHOAM|nr:hypothetical protein N8I77_009593 [Diaporthe amygdali]
MSAIKRLRPSEDDDIWRQNASIIRQLYQEEKKTLKGVKKIMENKNGFPSKPLSIWEVKLRELGMKRNLKSSEWPLVYKHVRPRLQHERKKELRKPTTILINGTEKPWDKVWREFRRNRAFNLGPSQGPLPPLPKGVVIRTPSPDLPETTIQHQQQTSSQSCMLQLFQTTLVSFQLLFGLHSQSEIETRDAFKLPDKVYRLSLEGIPLTRLLEKISPIDIRNGELSSDHTAQRLVGSQWDQLTRHSGSPGSRSPAGQFTPSTIAFSGVFAKPLARIESAPPSSQEVGINFDSYHYLSIIVHLLSNGHVMQNFSIYLDNEKKATEILDITFRLVSRRALLALLRSRMPSVKAAWESLLYAAGDLRNREAFKFLIRIGMDNNWLQEESRGHQHLYHAALNDCADIIDALIKRGCRPDSSIGPLQGEPAIMEAIWNGNLDCAKLLIQHCDVNELITWRHGQIGFSTAFGVFLEYFDGSEAIYHLCLDAFLERGADVDLELEEGLFPDWKSLDWDWEENVSARWRGWYEEDHFVNSWRPSVLDYVFHFRHSLFRKLATFSQKPGEFSRAGALSALTQGVHSLREYLARDWAFDASGMGTTDGDLKSADASEWKSRCLEVIFAEQFLLSIREPSRMICWKTVQGLMELEVDVARSSKDEKLASEMLLATARLITLGEGADGEHGFQILRWLLDRGFRVEALALSVAVEFHGVAILECLAAHCFDLKKHGVIALSKAAARSNFDATKFLLDEGVDPNSTFVRRNSGEISAFAAAFPSSSFEMIKYMIERGAKPTGRSPNRRYPDILVQIMSEYWDIQDILIKFRYIFEEVAVISDPSYPSAQLLEACYDPIAKDPEQRRKVFEFLFSKGARVTPGSPLAAWIAVGGGHQLVQEMLEQGADINAYSYWESYEQKAPPRRSWSTPLQAAAGQGDYALVCMLLEQGADMNRPAPGGCRKTPLSAICSWDPARPEERIRKDKIVKLFLDKGADVNLRVHVQPALNIAARFGDIPTAFILLKHGAKVNLESEPVSVGTALDAAASQGRLDMVEFLLNAGAESESAPANGKKYASAIQRAENHNYFVVADLIRRHESERERGWAVVHNPVTEIARPLGCAPQWSFPPGDSTMAHPAPSDGHEDMECLVTLNKENDVSYTPDGGSFDCSIVGFKTKKRAMSGLEAAAVNETRVSEVIQDQKLLLECRYRNFSGGKSDETAAQQADTWGASLGQEVKLGQPSGQNWVENKQQGSVPLVSNGLATDIFMGFSRSPIL